MSSCCNMLICHFLIGKTSLFIFCDDQRHFLMHDHNQRHCFIHDHDQTSLFNDDRHFFCQISTTPPHKSDVINGWSLSKHRDFFKNFIFPEKYRQKSVEWAHTSIRRQKFVPEYNWWRGTLRPGFSAWDLRPSRSYVKVYWPIFVKTQMNEMLPTGLPVIGRTIIIYYHQFVCTCQSHPTIPLLKHQYFLYLLASLI